MYIPNIAKYKTMLIRFNQIRFIVMKPKKTRKGVPELQGPALGCISVIDKNSA